MADDLGVRPTAWALLARAVGASLGAKKIAVAALGLVLLQSLGHGVASLWPDSPAPFVPVDPLPDARIATWEQLPTLLREASWALTRPARSILHPLALLGDPRQGRPGVLVLAVAILAPLVIWSLLGAAISRLALVRITSPMGEGIGVGTALGFALRRGVALLVAPLAPLLFSGLLIGGLAVFGLVCGALGQGLVTILGLLPLAVGLLLTVLLFGLIAGWPLMVATVAAEDEDGFDALSRSYAYVTQRPIRYGFYVALAWGFGLVGVLAVGTIAEILIQWTSGSLGLLADVGGTFAAGFWPGAVRFLAAAWADAYFWTAASVIYLLLRRDVDGSEWDDIDRLESIDEAAAFVPPKVEPAPADVAPSD